MVLMTEIANQAGNEVWPPLEAASRWFDRASIVLALSLLFGFGATVIIVWLGIVKEHHWDLLREAAAREISDAKGEAGRANEAAGKAHERAAALEAEAENARAELGKANAEIADAKKQTATLEKQTADAKERTAALENEAAQAKAEQERLKQLVLWREIARADMRPLKERLEAKPGTIKIAYLANDPETLFLAGKLEEIFLRAHWTVFLEGRIYFASLFWGVLVPKELDEVASALRAAHILVGPGDNIPRPDQAFTGPVPPGTPTILVGARPLPPRGPLPPGFWNKP